MPRLTSGNHVQLQFAPFRRLVNPNLRRRTPLEDHGIEDIPWLPRFVINRQRALKPHSIAPVNTEHACCDQLRLVATATVEVTDRFYLR
uniref:Uncharacterized protein n=1 Tax=Anopheles albimanus TaxID=7167 RepID=A0A182FM92_ANOAL